MTIQLTDQFRADINAASPYPSWSADHQGFTDGAIAHTQGQPSRRQRYTDPSYEVGWLWAAFYPETQKFDARRLRLWLRGCESYVRNLEVSPGMGGAAMAGYSWAKAQNEFRAAIAGSPGEHRADWREEAAHAEAPQAPLPAGEKFRNVSIE